MTKETRIFKLFALNSLLLSLSLQNHTDRCFRLFWLARHNYCALLLLLFLKRASTAWSQEMPWIDELFNFWVISVVFIQQRSHYGLALPWSSCKIQWRNWEKGKFSLFSQCLWVHIAQRRGLRKRWTWGESEWCEQSTGPLTFQKHLFRCERSTGKSLGAPRHDVSAPSSLRRWLALVCF